VALAVVLVVLLSVVVVGAVAWPLLRSSSAAGRSDAPADPGEDQRREVREDLDRSLAAIREIETDHQAGHLSDEDFAALDAAERARAVELIRRLDELGTEREA
jgi:flagellar biosynthesis/type III secretory pathway M-ring protein FliF/YscJ